METYRDRDSAAAESLCGDYSMSMAEHIAIGIFVLVALLWIWRTA